ncbi:MAG: hypothetical protein J1F13_02540 [Prevotellaceae bacterium]|nr:hypothetical protein [Prevotellaceae bacterium]
MEIIENKELRVEISAVGAEMQSLTDIATGRQLLWQGDPAYWQRRSPVLFPAVGGLWNGTYRTSNGTYRMPKHGFVREAEWQVSSRTEQSVTFAHEQTPEEAAMFPWLYRVEVEYRLEERRLCTTFRVYNTGSETMFFQMGGHPGFHLPDFAPDRPISGYIELEGRPEYLLRAAEQGCTVVTTDFCAKSGNKTAAVHYPVPLDADGLVPVCAETFANEALILPDHQISAATLLRTDGTPLVRVSSSAPVWLFWAPQDLHSPFVCFEPWYGLCDPIGFEGMVDHRPFINRLEAGTLWHGGYEILVY